MVEPSDARRMGTTVRAGLFAFALLILSFFFAAVFSHTAHALGLPAVSVDLPTGTLLAPVTSTVNKVTDNLGLPASVNSTPKTLGADVSLPRGPSQQSKPLQASVSVPLPNVVPEITNAVDKAASPATKAIAPVLESVANATQPRNNSRAALQAARLAAATAPQISADQSNSTATSSTLARETTGSIALSGDDERSVAAATIGPLLAGASNFIGSTVPSTVSNLVKGISGQEMNTSALLISAGIFVLMLTIITGLVYALNHYKIFTVGDGRMAQLAQNYDLTQLSVLIVVILGTGVIATYLILTHLGG